jgi:hypothetical protein
MKLDKQDTEQLMDLCEWILDYDEGLPNRDGDRTGEIVRMAHRFSRLINTHEDESWTKNIQLKCGTYSSTK